MGSAEKFCLRWNDFESNISVAFRELREEKDFFDVTLACEDSQVQAHKVILSACSPFFRSVLRRNPHQHPLLYLKGVKYQEMLSVLNFMYMGEVNVAQEELNSFLAVAEELRVKGLTQNNSEGSKPLREGPAREPAPPPKRPRPAPPPAPARQVYQQEEDEVQEVAPVKSEPREQQAAYQEAQESAVALEDGYQEEYGEYAQYEGYDGIDPNTGLPLADGNKDWDQAIEGLLTKDPLNNWYKCGQPACDHSSINRQNVVSHIQARHLPGFPGLACQHCHKSAPTTNALARHIQRVHKEPSKTTAMKSKSGAKLGAIEPNVTIHQLTEDCADPSDYYANPIKDWEKEVQVRMTKADNIWQCLECPYMSKNKTSVVSHIQGKHLEGFGGYVCKICGGNSGTYCGFEKHMSRQHSFSLARRNVLGTSTANKSITMSLEPNVTFGEEPNASFGQFQPPTSLGFGVSP